MQGPFELGLLRCCSCLTTSLRQLQSAGGLRAYRLYKRRVCRFCPALKDPPVHNAPYSVEPWLLRVNANQEISDPR